MKCLKTFKGEVQYYQSQKSKLKQLQNLLYKRPSSILEALKSKDLFENQDFKYMLFSNLTELLKHRPETFQRGCRALFKSDKEDNNYPLILVTLVGAIFIKYKNGRNSLN